MSALPKIAIGALATTAAAWFLNGPLGLGENCAVESRVSASQSAGGDLSSGGVASEAGAGAEDGFNTEEAPATAEATAACQSNVAGVASSGTINFAVGGSGVAADSSALVDRIAAAMKDCSGVSIEVAGHTDAQGDSASNQALSQRRAESIVAELVKRGVPTQRLTARGYGETKPVDPNGPESNPRNRRIEFTVSTAA